MGSTLKEKLEALPAERRERIEQAAERLLEDYQTLKSLRVAKQQTQAGSDGPACWKDGSRVVGERPRFRPMERSSRRAPSPPMQNQRTPSVRTTLGPR